MKNAIKRATSILLVLAIFASFTVTATAADHKAFLEMNAGYGNGNSTIIDYSGTGTVIKGSVISDQYATTTADGNYVSVPVYKGKYVKGKGASWSTWSSWGVNNKKSNPDFTVYNGTNKATQYEVENRTEYKYKQEKKTAVYAVKYYTKYQGNKWYNRLVTIQESSWNYYPGAKANYTIVQRYTKSEIKNYTYTVVYDNAWRTKAPALKSGDKPWEVYSSRTTYRYRSRTLTWDSKALVSYENVASRYSLFDKQGKPINYGIRWYYSQDLSQDKNYSFCIPGVYDKNIHVEEYYIPVSALLNLLQEKIDSTDGVFEKDSILELFDETLETIEDYDGMELLGIVGEWAPFIKDTISNIKNGKPVTQVINAEVLATSFIWLLIELSDHITNKRKQAEIDSLQAFVDTARDCVDRKSVIVIRFTWYSDRSCVGMNSDNFYSNYENSGTSLYSVDAMIVDNLEYVDMKLKANPFNGWQFAKSDNNFGTIQYLNEENQDAICYALKRHFENKYKILLPWNL